MESFYGGRTGASFIIKKSYDCVQKTDNDYQIGYYLYDPNEGDTGAYKLLNEDGNVPVGDKFLLKRTDENYKSALVDYPGCIWKYHANDGSQINRSDMYSFPKEPAKSMVEEFSKGNSSTNEVGYGEYVIIDTIKNMYDKLNPTNGQIYRRGINLENGLAGAEYVGQIMPPAADSFKPAVIGNYTEVPSGSPEDLTGDPDKAGWLITVGALDSTTKNFYAYNYETKTWYSIGTITDYKVDASNVIFTDGETLSDKSLIWKDSRENYLTTGNPKGVGTLSLNRKNQGLEDNEGQFSVALGKDVEAEGDYSFASGFETSALDESAHAEGCSSKAIGKYSHAEGYSTTAEGDGSHAEGKGTKAIGDNSHAEGGYTNPNEFTQAIGIGSHAEGSNTIAKGDYSHTEGRDSNTSVESRYAHAEGFNTNAKGIASHVEGCDTSVENNYAHAEGEGTIAKGIASHAEGGYYSYGSMFPPTKVFTTAEGDYSHAEGVGTKTIGDNSHAEGYGTTAFGDNSHAEGQETYSTGIASHAEGEGTYSTGIASHAEGFHTTAFGDYSHAEGEGTIANGAWQHVQGKYNEEDLSAVHIVGWGEDEDNRKNIYTLDEYGNGYYEGNLSVNNTIKANEAKLGILSLETGFVGYNDDLGAPFIIKHINSKDPSLQIPGNTSKEIKIPLNEVTPNDYRPIGILGFRIFATPLDTLEGLDEVPNIYSSSVYISNSNAVIEVHNGNNSAVSISELSFVTVLFVKRNSL